MTVDAKPLKISNDEISMKKATLRDCHYQFIMPEGDKEFSRERIHYTDVCEFPWPLEHAILRECFGRF